MTYTLSTESNETNLRELHDNHRGLANGGEQEEFPLVKKVIFTIFLRMAFVLPNT